MQIHPSISSIKNLPFLAFHTLFKSLELIVEIQVPLFKYISADEPINYFRDFLVSIFVIYAMSS